MELIKKESKQTEILALQEVNPNILKKLSPYLKDFSHVYDKGGNYKNDEYGQAVFVRKPLKISSYSKIFPYEKDKRGYGDLGFLQVIEIEKLDLALGGLQGKTLPGNKLDTKARLKQTEIILETFRDHKDKRPVIIGGDFNLLPETKCIAMMEQGGYKDLIKDFKIERTRNKQAWDQFRKKKGRFFEKQNYADYVFVNDKLQVLDFKVPKNEVSDHLPMILEFTL